MKTKGSGLEEAAMRRLRVEAAAPALLDACDAAIKHLQSDLVEPGRTVFWKLVAASKHARGE